MAEKRRFSFVVITQVLLLCLLVTVGLKLFQESQYLKRGVENLEKISALKEFQHNQVTSTKAYRNETVVKSKASKAKRISKAVVIFTTMRAGSSFVGELFNQHTQVFYSFEPLHAFGSRKVQEENRFRALHDVLTCDFVDLVSLYNNVTDTWQIVDDHSARCASDNFCFKLKSQFLRRDTDLCLDGKCKTPFDARRLSEICKRSLFPVAKIIVEPYLQALQPLVENPSLDLRVIHLVRDPRAIMSSRKKMFALYDPSKPFVVANQAANLCSQFEENLKFAECIEPSSDCKHYSGVDYWKGKYLRLRFEDVSLDPQGSAMKIYDFVGLNFDQSIRKWIQTNTNNTQAPNDIKNAASNDIFSTKRNSLATVGHWRKKLIFDEIDAVQKVCQSTFRRLNYKNILNAEQQNNETLDLWWQ